LQTSDVGQAIDRDVAAQKLESEPLRLESDDCSGPLYCGSESDGMGADVRADVEHGFSGSKEIAKQGDFGFAPFAIEIQRAADQTIVAVENENAVPGPLHADVAVLQKITWNHALAPERFT
jgi:hypothetical protein